MHACNCVQPKPGGCHACNPGWYPHYHYTVPAHWVPPNKGCICPPGSEKSCERRDCGRKDQPFPSSTLTALSPQTKQEEK